MFGLDFETPRLGSEMKHDWMTNLKVKFNPKLFAFIPIITIPAFLFRTLVPIALLIVITIVLSYIGNKTKIKRVGIELVTFTTIITGVSFGALPGIIMGVSLMIIHNLVTRRVGIYWIIVMPVFGLLGALASLYSGVNILMLGIGLTIFSHVLFIMFQSVTQQFPAKYIPYMLFNILFNAFLFYRFAPLFV